jgi:hypothetical protein
VAYISHMTIWDTWGVSPAEPVFPSGLVTLKVTLATREGEAWNPVCISQLEFHIQPMMSISTDVHHA